MTYVFELIFVRLYPAIHNHFMSYTLFLFLLVWLAYYNFKLIRAYDVISFRGPLLLKVILVSTEVFFSDLYCVVYQL